MNHEQDKNGKKGKREDACLDWWSLVHFFSGVIIGFILNALGFDFFEGFLIAIVLLTLWEIIEPYIWPGWNESKKNQICDIIVGLLGYILAKLIDFLIDSLAYGEADLDFSLSFPSWAAFLKLAFIFVSIVWIARAAGKNVMLRANEKEAKGELIGYLESVKEIIDGSDLSEKEKARLKEKIDEAIKLIRTCKDEDLDGAIEILGELMKELEEAEKPKEKKEGEGGDDDEDEGQGEQPSSKRKLINALGVAKTFALLIKIKKNWEGRIKPGIKNIVVVGPEGEGENRKCKIVIQVSNGAKALGRTDQEVEIKLDKCEEAKTKVPELVERVKKCEWPTQADAEMVWGWVDP